jgi:PTS system mannose-specific IIA component
MIGIVIVTHSDLANAFIRTVECIIGSQKSLIGVSLDTSDGIEEIKHKISSAIERVYSKEGVLILTDMLGGSPSIATLSIKKKLNIEIISGVNLPMIIEAILNRERYPLSKLVKLVISKSKNSITAISKKV